MAYLEAPIITITYTSTGDTVPERPFVVAELAQGFEGSEEQAKLLVRAAFACGADAAKLQLVYAHELATPDYKYFSLFESLELSDRAWCRIVAYARTLPIDVHFEIFGSQSLALAEQLTESVKIHPTDMTNLRLLDELASSSINTVYLGVGGATRSEIFQAATRLRDKSIVLILGFQGYPTPVAANQLTRINILKSMFGDGENVRVGFADHSAPDDLTAYGLPAMALGMDVSVIEKHLTLGKVIEMEDHESAFNPDEFKSFREMLDACAEARGEPTAEEDFGMTESEIDYRNAVRRQVVTRQAISQGTRLTADHICLKRTSLEDSLDNLQHAYGQVLVRDVPANVALHRSDLR